MARKLIDIARILRSKNAGPLYVTFDIIFDTLKELDAVLDSGVINQQLISDLYRVNLKDVSIIPYRVVNACKITIPRKYVSGNVCDDDIYGCQQHMKLANVLIP
jgi:Domain of unknown function (DUF4387)